VAEHFLKASLMVVKPLLALVVDSTDVHNNVASVKDFGISSAFDVYSPVLTVHYTTRIMDQKDLHLGKSL
jgi:hypothetical protein